MNLFDRLVETALEADSGYTSLRPVVEKESLHFDILREMNKAGYLKELVFIGGTCLRKFLSEMSRFLTPSAVSGEMSGALWWDCLLETLRGILQEGGGISTEN